MAVDVWPGELEDARAALRGWLSARGFHPSGASWEFLAEAPQPGFSYVAAEIVVPYRWR